MHPLQRFTGFLVSVLLMVASMTTLAATDPRQVVSDATTNVITALEQTKPSQRTPQMFRELVTEFILPAIDQEKIAMGALGKYWRIATPEERSEFIEVFRERQLNTYSGAFKAYDGQELTFTESRFSPEGDRAIVKGQFTQSGG